MIHRFGARAHARSRKPETRDVQLKLRQARKERRHRRMGRTCHLGSASRATRAAIQWVQAQGREEANVLMMRSRMSLICLLCSAKLSMSMPLMFETASVPKLSSVTVATSTPIPNVSVRLKFKPTATSMLSVSMPLMLKAALALKLSVSICESVHRGINKRG